MSKEQFIIARARRYGETKRGPHTLKFLIGNQGIRVEVRGDGLLDAAELRRGELDRLTRDEAAARLCDLIDRLLFNIRDTARRPAELRHL